MFVSFGVRRQNCDGNGETETAYYAVAVYDGEENTVNTYVSGTELKIEAEGSKERVFVCWLANGEFYSFKAATSISIDKNVVMTAVYASYAEITLDYGGGPATD